MLPDKNIAILIVDDFSVMRRIIRNILREMGYSNIVEADDGKTAIPILKDMKIDLVLTDWNMPGMMGIDLVKFMRAEQRYSHIPIIMVTAENKKEQIIEAAQAGINGYIIKPFNLQTLRDKIEKAYSRLQV